MRLRAVVTFATGLVLAGGAVYYVDQQLKLQRGLTPQAAAQPPAIALTKVVLAKQDLAYGTKLKPEYLVEVDWPASAAPQGSFPSVKELLGDGKEERIVLRAVSKDEPLLQAKVSGFGGKATIATKLTEGKRASSIRINDVNGVAGFVLPGDRVDVLLTREVGDEQKDLVTDIILQGIVVLGIDQLTDEQRDKPQVARTATVEVTPEEAQKLALAMQVGTLSLALRNIGSVETAKTQRIRVSDLARADTPTGKRRELPTVKVRRAVGNVTVETVGGG
jgi:pilus assembly protein CpaB